MIKFFTTFLIAIFSWINIFAQKVSFINSFGGSHTELSHSVAIDSSANIYSTGSFKGTTDFNPGVAENTLTAISRFDGFVNKLDSAGNFVWVKQIESKGLINCDIITTDRLGNVYISGKFYDTTDFDPGSSVSNLIPNNVQESFLLKLDSSGLFKWVKRIAAFSSSFPINIKTDFSNNIYLTGSFEGIIDFNPGTGIHNLTSSGGDDIFILKLNSNGDFLWAERIGGISDETPFGINVDKQNNLYISGSFEGTVDFNPSRRVNNLVGIGGRDGFVLKLDSLGNYLWVRGFIGSGFSHIRDITIGPQSNVYVAGVFSDTLLLSLGGNILRMNTSGSSTLNAFVSKIDSEGNLLWAKQLKLKSGTMNIGGISTDKKGFVYTSGNFTDAALDLDPGVDSCVIENNFIHWDNSFLCVLNDMGDFQWGKHFKGTKRVQWYSIAIDRNDNIYGLGLFEEKFILEDSLLAPASVGDFDVFICKISGSVSQIFDTIYIEECDSIISPSKNYIWNQSGIYTDTIINHLNCDTILSITLTINTVDTAITRNLYELTASANGVGVSYQWLDCTNGDTAIIGATSQTYTVVKNGDYAVEVTQNGCVDTSSCISIINVGLTEYNRSNKLLKVYPNPSTNKTTIELELDNDYQNIQLYDVTNNLLKEVPVYSNTISIDVSTYAKGIYLLRYGITSKKLIIQ